MKVVKVCGKGANRRLCTAIEGVPQIGNDEVLVKVGAASLHYQPRQTAHTKSFSKLKNVFYRQNKSSIHGNIFSGVIVSVGSDVRLFEVGDHVFGISEGSEVCAEYIRMRDSGVLTFKPLHLSHAEAATIPYGALQAQHFMEKPSVVSAKSMIIFGANQPIGVAAVQLASNLGIAVTAVSSAEHAQELFNMGAMDVIDPHISIVKRLGYTFDIVLDCNKELSILDAWRYLSPSGIFLKPSAGMLTKLVGFMIGVKVYSGIARFAFDDLQRLSNLVFLDKYKPLVYRIYSIESILPAFYFMCSGRAFGGVAIQVSDDECIGKLSSV